MSANAAVQLDVAALSKKWDEMAVPFDGDNGLFAQSWYPICLSSEVTPGKILGQDFLDGRVVVYRTSDGTARVMSAYCPHVGADLSVGDVVGDTIRCAFHHWQYDATGRCVKTAVGDPPPPTACLFAFPTAEKYGIIWAFNGTEPLYDMPQLEFPEQDLILHPFYTDEYNCDGWIFACNTPDMQHIKVVHGIKFRHDDPHQDVNWHKWGFDYRITAEHGQGPDIDWRIGITGSTIFFQQGTVDGWWLGVYAGFSLPRPGKHRAFVAIAVQKGDGSPETIAKQKELLDFGTKLLKNTAAEDKPVLDTIKYRPRNLTRGDRTLAKYLDILRNYPRAHPSAPFIR